MKQGRFSGAALTDQRKTLTALDFEVDMSEDREVVGTGFVGFREIRRLDGGRRGDGEMGGRGHCGRGRALIRVFSLSPRFPVAPSHSTSPRLTARPPSASP